MPPKTPEQSPETTPPGAVLNASAVPVEQLTRMLGLSMDHLRQHVAQGAPTNANGSINLVHYAAWLNAPAPGNSADTGQPDAHSGGG